MSEELNSGDAADRLKGLMADIVSAYVSRNAVPAAELPALISTVQKAMSRVVAGDITPPVEAPTEPAVPIKESINRDYIVCLEDGKKFKTLRRHLASTFGLTPEGYRAKWGLPSDYPMVAPAYSATRSRLAKATGLGSGGASGQTIPRHSGGTTKKATRRQRGKTA